MLFLRKMNSIENVRIFTIPGFLLKGAFAFPGLGIFVQRAHMNNKNLLMHEFGHILQFRKYGFLCFGLKLPRQVFLVHLSPAFIQLINTNVLK